MSVNTTGRPDAEVLAEMEDKKIVNNYYCTVFKKKKNQPLATFSVHTKEEEGAKYLLILKGYMGKLPKELFENIKDYIFTEGKLSKEGEEIGEKFDKEFRLFVSTK